jgi:hypothetical protein
MSTWPADRKHIGRKMESRIASSARSQLAMVQYSTLRFRLHYERNGEHSITAARSSTPKLRPKPNRFRLYTAGDREFKLLIWSGSLR